ncbi:PAS domain S-box protein [Bacillus salacetis]|uniref:PAS domain S-box protein n=1 Tax=Bacillus salacetis TaxID=2315464 RepID=UPI003BA08E40
MLGEENNPELFYASFQFAAVGMALADIQGDFLMVNPSLTRITGYSNNDLMQKRDADITYHEDINLDLRFLQQLLNGEISYYEVEKRYINKEGHKVWVHLSVSAFEDNKGQKFLIYQVKDINRRKKAEKNLRRSEEQYRKLVELCPDAICVHNKNEILYVNEAGLKELDVKEEELVGKPILSLLNDGYHQFYYGIVNEDWSAEQLEFSITLPDGREKDLICSSTPIMFQGEKAFQVVFRDNTYNKELEKTNDILLQQSEKMNLVGELAAGIAHEIRNPLTSLKGFLQLLSADFEDHSFPYDKIIFSEIDRINSIINELLLLAKPTIEELKKLDIRHVVNQVALFMKAQANMYNIEVLVDLPKYPVILEGSENKLKQVFINLLQNSIEAMPSGGKITIEISVLSETFVLSFKDEGYGIPDELIDKIGKPFFTTKENGTGLGLMVTNNIIQHHKGSLSILSKEGEGTEILITFPRTNY